MPPATEPESATPAWKVMINGRDLPPEVEPDVISVLVEHYVDGPDAFSITVNVWNGATQEFNWLDDGTFPEGAAIDIHLGYEEDLEKMLSGEIVSLELEGGPDSPPVLRVEGYDKLHRFRRGKKTRTFREVKDSQVAEQVARDLQLTPEVEDSQIVHPFLFQFNQTDIDFLKERAYRINYELAIEDNTFRFRKAANHLGKATGLGYGDQIRSLTVRLSTLTQVSQVVVRGWNMLSKEAIVGLGGAGDETSRMGGQHLGAALTTGAFGESRQVIVDGAVFNQAEADQMAKAIFNRTSLKFLQAEGEALGNKLLKAGRVVELQGLGARFSGLYYLRSTHHQMDAQGYLTRFTSQRNASQ